MINALINYGQNFVTFLLESCETSDERSSFVTCIFMCFHTCIKCCSSLVYKYFFVGGACFIKSMANATHAMRLQLFQTLFFFMYITMPGSKTGNNFAPIINAPPFSEQEGCKSCV